MKTILKFFPVLLMAVLVSCAPTTSKLQLNLASFQERPEDTRIAKIKPPRYILQKKTPRIAILDIADHSGLTSMKKCDLGPMATDILHNVVASIGRYEVVERAQAKKIGKELGYQEAHGVDWENIEKKYFSLGQGIDYVIVGAINRVTVKTDVDIPMKTCSEEGEVSLSLRIVDLSNGNTIKAFNVHDKQVNIKSIMKKCYISCGLVQEALEKTIERWVPVKLQEAIPLYGYINKILSSYSKEEKKWTKIAYITLGSANGLRPGDKVIIMKIEKDVDPISGKEKYRYIDLGKAVVAQTGLRPHEAIIVITDPYLMKEVKIGYLVQTTADRARRAAQAARTGDEMKVLFQKLLK